jgi:hypothetical protein
VAVHVARFALKRGRKWTMGKETIMRKREKLENASRTKI